MLSDVYNIQHGIAKELWKKYNKDIVSVRMWAYENCDNHYFYNHDDLSDVNDILHPEMDDSPFCIAMQNVTNVRIQIGPLVPS